MSGKGVTDFLRMVNFFGRFSPVVRNVLIVAIDQLTLQNKTINIIVALG